MASIYKKRRSPFWFIQFIDHAGLRRNKSTGLRTDDPSQTVKARALRAQMEAKELNHDPGDIDGGGWDAWAGRRDAAPDRRGRASAELRHRVALRAPGLNGHEYL